LRQHRKRLKLLLLLRIHAILFGSRPDFSHKPCPLHLLHLLDNRFILCRDQSFRLRVCNAKNIRQEKRTAAYDTALFSGGTNSTKGYYFLPENSNRHLNVNHSRNNNNSGNVNVNASRYARSEPSPPKVSVRIATITTPPRVQIRPVPPKSNPPPPAPHRRCHSRTIRRRKGWWMWRRYLQFSTGTALNGFRASINIVQGGRFGPLPDAKGSETPRG